MTTDYSVGSDMLIEDFDVDGYRVHVIGEPEEEQFELDDALVVLSGPVGEFTVEGKEKLFIREGTWCEKDERDEWQPDWSLTWIYRDINDPSKWEYYEQDAMQIALHNYLYVIAN